MEDFKKIILFGAGEIGKQALYYWGTENVHCFVDNSAAKVGTTVEGIPVISFSALKKIYVDFRLVITVDPKKYFVLAAQLDDAGISDYTPFLKSPGSVGGVPLVSVTKAGASLSQGKKKVLMAAYFFPPLSGSGVYRSIKFVKYLRDFNWEPTVISTDQVPPDQNYMDESLTAEIPDGVEVIRVPDFIGTLRKTSFPDYKDDILEFLGSVLKKDKTAAAVFDSLRGNRIGEAELLTCPCAALTWAYDVVRYIEKNIDIHQFQVIYTTSGPFSAHLIGAYFQSKYGIPWVADYRDPWTQNAAFDYDTNSVWYKLFSALESIFLHQADCSLTVAPNLAETYIDRFQLERNKMVCITNGYDEADFGAVELPQNPMQYFIINYSGLIYGQGRSIVPILKALQQLRDENLVDITKIRFRIVGTKGAESEKLAANFGLQEMIVQTGYVSHIEALQSNQNAHILLLLAGCDAKFKYFFTGKIFDYLRIGKPILAIVPKDGIVDKTLRETGHGEAFLDTEIPQIKEMILREYQKWQRGEEQKPLRSPLIQQFERRHLTGMLAEVFQSVCS